MKTFYPRSPILKLFFLFIGILYLQNAQSQTPDLVSFSPQSARPGYMITITGTNLTRVKDIYFGSKKGDSLTIYNDTMIRVSVPSGAGAVIYAYDIDNQWVNDSLAPFSYLPASAPKISGFDEDRGINGSTVNIYGGNFADVTSVTFGGVEAAQFTIITTNLIKATVGSGASGAVKVTTATGVDSINGFTYAQPRPRIISFTPTTAAPGTTVTIRGNYFNDVTNVAFGNVPARSFSIENSTTINAVVDNGNSGYVTVFSNFGDTSLAGFTMPSQAPKITSFTPKEGAAGTQITINGTNLNNLSSVSFEYVSAGSFQIISPTQVVATVGSGKTGHVFVNSPDGHDSLGGFTFIAPPTLTSFSPTQAKSGDTIMINGSNFSFATSVSFGGVPASFLVGSDNVIWAVVGQGASGEVSVTNPAGSITLGGFTVTGIPTVASFSPLVGTVGTVVTVRGTHFTSANKLLIGQKTKYPFNVISDSIITFTVDSAYSGPITVMSSSNEGVPSVNAFAFDGQIEPEVAPSGANPVSGPLTTKISVDSTVQTYNGLPYVQRHYDIEPANNASTATATITLYFFQEDFDNYNNFYTTGLRLPASPGDANGKANLKIYQYHGFSATSVPGTYDEHGIEIDPDDNNIVWNSNTNLWEVTFDVTGFSGFFIGTNSSILPLKLLSFTANPTSDAVTLRWTTTSEIKVDRFEIQKSDDGRQFATRGTVNANGSEASKTSYSFIDNIATEGASYYRLKMIDIDGKFGYSKVVKVIAFANNAGLLLYPNPASTFIKVSHPFIKNNITIRIIDVNGKVIKQLSVAKGTKETSIDLKGLSSGTYTLIWNNGEQTFSKTVLVQ
ncbi:IPT/TIG domain-containing protein [Chitinophagaceae bacterium 26-R-25]|nr:IPT/TIG domain-containing protein [Chitinophagaceae bacterium 26-R-25]